MTTTAEPVTYPFNQAAGLDLAEAYSKARDTPGLTRVQLPFGDPAWLATRYDDVRLVLGDRRFSRAMAAEHDAPRVTPGQRPGGILGMDPPDHTRLRTLVAKAFTKHRVEALRPRVRELAGELLDGIEAAGPPADLVEDYALPIPVAVICEMLGVPVEDRPRFRLWSDRMLSTTTLTAEQMEQNQEEVRAYMAGLVAEHRTTPQDDLMTALIEARDVRDRLTELEMVDLCVGILVAGHETTASQIPNFVHVLFQFPDELAKLRANPELIPNAIEELLRYVPLGSGSGSPRYATEDIEVGDVVVRAGEPVVVSIGAANRDPRRFDQPELLQVDREAGQHVGFGHGVHHCLGAQLARLELQEALLALVTRFPGLKPAGDIVWKDRMVVRGPKHMPIGW